MLVTFLENAWISMHRNCGKTLGQVGEWLAKCQHTYHLFFFFFFLVPTHLATCKADLHLESGATQITGHSEK